MKFWKRSLSVVLTFLMIFSSMSVLASAELGDGKQTSITFDTKFYRFDGSEWIETTKAARGEKIKIRTFCETDFYMSSSSTWFFFDKAQIEFDTSGYSESEPPYRVKSNQGLTGIVNVLPDGGLDGADLIEFGFIPSNSFERYAVLNLQINGGKTTKITPSDWFWEFTFTVKDDAKDLAQFFVCEGAIVDSENEESQWNPTSFGKVADADGDSTNLVPESFTRSYDWKLQYKLYDQDADSTLTFTNPVKFNAGEGTFANGASEFTTGEGFIGEALSAADQPAAVTAPGGKSFVGWVPSTVDLATATAADCVDVSAIKYNYAVDTYNALYETTAATTFNFTFDPNGGAFADASTEAKTVTVNEGEAVNAPVPTRVGYEFKGWALSTVENPTVDDVQTLPETASADMSYKAVWSKNSYNVKWIVDGVTVKEEPVAYGDELPAAPSVDAKAGYNFAWSSAPATMPAADVEITGAYTPIVYTVTWKIDGEQGTYKQTQATFGEAIATPEAPIEKEGYTFEWRGIPETMPADENLVITGYYVANSYTVTWTVDGKEFTTTTVKYGDAIIAPDYTAEAGYDFAWDEIPATMPANDITINGTTTAKTYTVTWNVNGEKVGETTVKFGDAIADYAFDAPEGYEFSGWTDKPATMPASDITVNGTTTAKSYTVTWNVNGEKVGETTVKFGDAIADYEYAAPTGYNFSGWTDKPETMPASNITVNGTTTAKTYTVTWKVDGEVVGTTTETFGQPIADFNYDAPVGSTFGGWLDKPETMPDNENLVINGTLSADIHTITWKVNGEVIATTSAVYGAEIADYAYTAPTGYTFSGWTDKPATMPANNIEVNGTTTIKTYTVKWTINGEYYNSTEVKYGEAVTAPQYTIPAGHSFAWGDIPSAMPDDDNLVINGTLTINRYTITYYYDEAETQVYFTETLDYGAAPTAKEAPTLKGKKFVDWDGDVPAALTQDVKLHALFTDIEYTVIFKGPEGNLLDWTVTYEDAIDAITAEDAAVEGYTFTGVWNYNGAAVTFPTTVKTLTGDDDKAATEFVFEGVYNINIYHIVFYKSEADKANGIVLHEQDYEFNTDISNAVADPTMEGHTFLGWDHEPAIVESNDEFIGQWDINTYTVTWKVGDDFTTTTMVKYGAALVAPEYTPAAGYDFEWVDVPATMPANDALVISGKLTAKTYTVTWKVNGEIVGTTTVTFGEAIADYEYTAPAGYTFGGWTDKPDTMPANDIVVNGTTTPKTYTVTWKVGDDFTTTTEVRYGEALAAPAYTPAAGYDFEWVDVPATMPANDALVISGKLTAKTYTVTWKVNGEIVGTTTETFGEAIADYAYTAPTGYTFSGWTDKPETMPADDALVINGTNIANKYTVKFVDADGAEISSGEFEFGSDITAPTINVPEGMTLVGWVDGDGEAFTGKVPAKNVTYRPNIVSDDNVPYAIEIYLENVDGVYELSGSTSLTGTTGQSVSAVAGEVSGFTFNAAESTLTAIIAGDGSTKLVLKYSRNVYTATFDGVEYTVRYGAALPDVTPADKTGMEFVGWVDAQGNKAPATMPANDLALTSKWEAIEYTITYIVNGQKTVETYKYGDTVIAPADPVVDKMTFTGWSMEIPTTMPAENLIIIASFESTGTVDAYTVTFWADGVEFQKTLVKVGSEITLPTKEPTKEFYVFKGWKDVPAAMPANDIDIYAEFERVPVTLIPKAGSTTVIDRDNMVIYGLQERMSEATYNTYLDVEGDGHFTVTATANGFGTGTVIELYDNVTGQLLETYYVVIFGDLNGDSRVNATDVSLANDEVLSVTGWSLKQVYSNGVLVDNPDYKVYMTMAADLNGDGRIDSIDTSIISNRALALTYIDQVTGRATEA